MDKIYYGFNSSEDVIELQTKYSLFKRVANILFSVSFDNGFDRALMEQALNELIKRNDCLRLTFVKKDKKTLQYFEEERKIGNIPYKKFATSSEMDAFIRRYRKKVVSPYAGKTIEAVFVNDPSGRDEILVKVSHFAADTYAIGLLVNDLNEIYKALSTGSELPPAPGKFEDVLKKDIDYKNNVTATEKDREFFKKLYTETHSEHPSYCGAHGLNSDRWLKYKKKGMFSLPYLMVRCDTEGYNFIIPSAVTSKAAKWCEDNQITMSCFFFYCLSVASSLLNGKEKYLAPIDLLNCRGTLAERRCGGTKVQSMSVYTTVDYDKTFKENVEQMQDEQNELYRHTRLTYLEVEKIQHDFWKHPMLSQITSFAYSFIPMSDPEGMKVQMYSNGKGALVSYIALLLNVKTNEINMIYDIQTKMITPQQLVEFQNMFVHVVETVVENPDKEMKLIF